jgi:predicted dehydrogenase
VINLDKSDSDVIHWPNEIVVIGGGRWARVIVGQLQDLVPKSTTIKIHTSRNIIGMSKWVDEQRYKNVWVEAEFLRFDACKTSAVIVANAARDHEMAIDAGLNVGAAVLVEKPVTLSTNSARRLSDLAKDRGLYFASAHVFMFARYIAALAKQVVVAGPIEHIRVIWCDQKAEERYGENKTYDPSLPIYADCLPHVLSIFEMLAPDLPLQFVCLSLYRGGSHLELQMMLGTIPCSIRFERNSDARQRIIEVPNAWQHFRCDFTREPGVIFSGEIKEESDMDWDRSPRPLASQLTAFLRGAGGGYRDPRLDIKHGLRACRMIDVVSANYNEAQQLWMVENLLVECSRIGDDLHYALSELLLAKGIVDSLELKDEINRVYKDCSGRSAAYIGNYLGNYLGNI